jgi:uncharacterized protein (TIGR02147 family)
MSEARPSVFEYLDHRQFLKDWFDWKKSTNRRFSHRMFARLAKQKSPSLMLLVQKGERNLTPATTRSFAKAMQLDADETRFFTMLVNLDAAQDSRERTALFEKIAATARFRAARRIEGETFQYLTHWYIPAIREMAAMPGFQPDPTWIARRIRPRITVAKAKAALSTLHELGMVQVDDDGTVHLADGDFVTPHEVAGLAVHNYHRGMLERSMDAIDAFKSRDRHLGAATVRIPLSRMTTLKQEVSTFLERTLDLAESELSETERLEPQMVVQVNAQLFPMTAAVDTPEST